MSNNIFVPHNTNKKYLFLLLVDDYVVVGICGTSYSYDLMFNLHSHTYNYSHISHFTFNIPDNIKNNCFLFVVVSHFEIRKTKAFQFR